MTKQLTCDQLHDLTETAQTLVCAVSDSMSLSSALISLAGPTIIGISAIIALVSLKQAREIARKKATLDLIEKAESNDYYRRLHSTFSYYKRTGDFARLHAPKEEKDSRDRGDVLDFLSHYELVSIGIEKGILDIEFYRQWMANPFVRDWNAAADFVQRERWKQNTATQEWYYYPKLLETYQRVALCFDEAAIDLTENYAGPPEQAEGPGDKPLP